MTWALAAAVGLALGAAPGPAQPPGEVFPGPPAFLVPRAIEPSKPPFQWSLPKVVEDAPVASDMESLGVPVRAHAVRSEERMEVLYEHLVRAFRQADLYIPPPKYQFHLAGAVSLTAIDDERMLSYTAIFQPNPDGTTTVILGEADLGARRPPPPPEGPPAFPGAGGVLRSRSEGALSLTYHARATPEEVIGFYREVFGEHGYHEVEPGAFRRGEDVVTVMTTARGDGRVSVVVLERAAPKAPSFKPGAPLDAAEP